MIYKVCNEEKDSTLRLYKFNHMSSPNRKKYGHCIFLVATEIDDALSFDYSSNENGFDRSVLLTDEKTISEYKSNIDILDSHGWDVVPIEDGIDKIEYFISRYPKIVCHYYHDGEDEIYNADKVEETPTLEVLSGGLNAIDKHTVLEEPLPLVEKEEKKEEVKNEDVKNEVVEKPVEPVTTKEATEATQMLSGGGAVRNWW